MGQECVTGQEVNGSADKSPVEKKSNDTIGIRTNTVVVIHIWMCTKNKLCASSLTAMCYLWRSFLASAVFLSCVAAGAGIFAFASTLASARKMDPNMFAKGQCAPVLPATETGVQLAVRALKWGTFYAVGGCGLFAFGVWKMSGANDASIPYHRYKCVLTIIGHRPIIVLHSYGV